MLKATIKVYKNTDIGKYSKLTAYLKSCTHNGDFRCLSMLTNLKSTDVKDPGSYLLVSIPDTKTGISRKFTIIIEEGFCKIYFSSPNSPNTR
ncbi:hypothetical protein NQ315_005122 [Exocentrus adspersus]|uniref:LAGLIDADG homing endonuclease n=1 Tax=Exocentrus adspersus TaxID=1586481 RepID=A0AAV8VUW5_9CUCU|nr:hypothetical protein NQ315_005122 [Exocentrus adspersus]